MFVVDTSILVHAADEDAPLHARCRELLDAWRRQPLPWYLTWGILYEFLRVTTHPRVFRKPWSAAQAWRFVEVLLESPSLGILVPTQRHAEAASRIFEELPHLGGNLMHDAHTAALMREHGIVKIYTRDTDFHRFPFLETVDPTT